MQIKIKVSILKFLKRHSVYASLKMSVNGKEYREKDVQPQLKALLAENLIIKEEKKYKITELGLKEVLKYDNPNRIKLKIEECKQNNKAINLSSIARELGLTRQAVNYLVKTHNIEM